MQATVYRYDQTEGHGSVLMDNGRELPFSGGALAASGLRFLRPGQRVNVELGPGGYLDRIWISGIGPGQLIR